MLSFILILLFGLAVAFFAGQNTLGVSINLANYQLPRVPLYVVIVSSMLVGFVVSWLVSLLDALFNSFTIQNKNNVIRNDRKKIDGLQNKIHEQELEIARLKGEEKQPVNEQPVTESKFRPSLFGGFRHIA